MAKAPVRGEGGTPSPKKKGNNTKKPGAGFATPSEKKAAAGGGGGRNKGKNGKKVKKGSRPVTNEVLNPPFDPRMRRIGSPASQADKIKRGWIIAEDTRDRVNFLFNPSQLDLAHGVDSSIVKNPNQAPNLDTGSKVFYTSTGMTLNFKLLYDRTYELFSPPDNKRNASHKFGVFADVAGWYRYLGMLDGLPENWEDTLVTSPPWMILSYLFIGPRLTYYGWCESMSVTYSHWTQEMIPSRCAVDIAFRVLPYGLDSGGGGKSRKDYVGPGRGWGNDDLPDRGGIPRGGLPEYSPGDPGFAGTR